MQNTYNLGIDIGSTTVKTVVMKENGELIYTEYKRHFSKVRESVCEQLRDIHSKFGENIKYKLAITGSAGLGIANAADLPFVQEVFAAFIAVQNRYDDIDVVIELGGEDAKIIFLTGGVEQRMNGSCAGGTGAFIDQMATLLGVTPTELDEMSLKHKKVYPIASRCGVFAKSDIQPLLNQGANREDVAASVFQAVVDQTVSGLAQGRQIKGKILFLGGPLSFLKGLRNAFVKTLELNDENAIFPDEAPCFMALGSALFAKDSKDTFELNDVIDKITNIKINSTQTGERLFNSKKEYEEFIARHSSVDAGFADIRTYEGDAYLGIDAGSTTTKLVLITPDGRLLYQHYCSNEGRPLDEITSQLTKIYDISTDGLVIRSSGVTGYGEELIKAALGVDYGMVETVAHFTAARFFEPHVDFIIDIGGQDIKCFKIKNGAIDSIMLNEACSSGCGSFIQTFAQALGYGIEEFSKLGLFADNPVDLGSRCTVFMNSSVKQAQKDGASVEDISAGLSSSIIKNAIYKVIRATSPDSLGEHIVVQGGTFLNDAVLRSFEMELGRNVVRPAIAGLMGAFGAALYARDHATDDSISSIISKEDVRNFTYTSKAGRCGACTANCSLTIAHFSDGRKFISGNRCERPLGIKNSDKVPNMYGEKLKLLYECIKTQKAPNGEITIGIPLSLGFYEQLPLWVEFFGSLGMKVIINDESTRELYYKGQHTIPSDTVCYPAKLVHGAVIDLQEKGVDAIFYPCMTYNFDEEYGDNHYNCPVVAYYPELLKANIDTLNDDNFIHPYIDLNRPRNVIMAMTKELARFGIKKSQVRKAFKNALTAHNDFMEVLQVMAKAIIAKAREKDMQIIVLAGRPYHIDPEINHGIHKLIASLDMAVISEDGIFQFAAPEKVNVLNQWTYHARLYNAAEYVASQPDMQLVQLVSFGCGIDAITSDEIRDILEKSGKLYTQLKIDEINNLGAAKIRMRSLVAAIEEGGDSDGEIHKRDEEHAQNSSTEYVANTL